MSAAALTAPILLDDQHRYTVNGVEFPSVTKILHASGLADFSAIPERIREHVLARGRAVHNACHYMLEGDLDESSLDPEIAGSVEALRQFLFHSGFEVVPGMIERRIFDPINKFCGTFDAVGRLPAFGGALAVVDWKRGMLSGVEYQTAAYLKQIPGVYHRAAIQLHNDGRFSVKTFSPLTLLHHQRLFVAALEEYRRKSAT